jgi:hypothetical protein
MNLPGNTSLPFFSYGLFRPGQIGFRKIRPHVAQCADDCSVPGRVKERDGLPLLLDAQHEWDKVPGTLITFLPEGQEDAYRAIAEIELDNLYRWDTVEVHLASGRQQANVLFGRKGDRGSHDIDYGSWDGSKDPMFTHASDIVRVVLKDNREKFDWDDPAPTLRLQMAYMLLWTAIERFASFKYHLGEQVTGKVFRLADEPEVRETLLELNPEPRQVVRTSDPGRKETLIAADPKKALSYYYQLRSNVVHRGKTAPRDHERLVQSLDELLTIFQRILDSEFRID